MLDREWLDFSHGSPHFRHDHLPFQWYSNGNSLQDVDGDGYLDIVESDKESELKVTRSAIGTYKGCKWQLQA